MDNSVIISNLTPIGGQLLMFVVSYVFTIKLIKESSAPLRKTFWVSAILIVLIIFVNLNFMQDYNEMVRLDRGGLEVHSKSVHTDNMWMFKARGEVLSDGNKK